MKNNNAINLGVIIRTTGERTEELCLESVLEHIDINDVTILRNISPPYAVYLKQFELISSSKYDYTLCLDADIILCEDWYNIIINIINKYKHFIWYSLIGCMLDRQTKGYLYRGCHIYDKSYSKLSYYFIQCSEYLFKHKHIARHINTRITSRVESTLIDYYLGLNIKCIPIANYILGWHGYEQYNCEIFRQFAMRHYRNPNFKNPKNTPFLYKPITDMSVSTDEYIARLGWDNYLIFDYRDDINTIKNKIANFLAQAGLPEKTESLPTLEDFRLKYNDPVMKMAKIYQNKWQFWFHKYKWFMWKRILKNFVYSLA